MILACVCSLSMSIVEGCVFGGMFMSWGICGCFECVFGCTSVAVQVVGGWLLVSLEYFFSRISVCIYGGDSLCVCICFPWVYDGVLIKNKDSKS